MKTKWKYLLAILMIMAFWGSVYAVDFGLKAGLQCQDNFKRIDGYKVGVFVNLPLKSRFSLQAEAFFSTLRMSYAGESVGADSLWDFIMHSDTLHYLEVPLTLKYVLTSGGKIRPHVFVGPYASFRLNRSPDYMVESIIGTVKATARSYNSVEGGLLMGIGFQSQTAKSQFSLDIRFNYGFTTIRTLYSDYVWESIQPYYESNNRTLSVVFGFGF